MSDGEYWHKTHVCWKLKSDADENLKIVATIGRK